MDDKGLAEVLRFHREELLSVLTEIASALEAIEKKGHPRAHVKKLLDHYRGTSKIIVLTGWRLGHAVRQVHDFYGWKAKGDVRRRGLCSGALYRTAAYLRIPKNARCGSRLGKTVHIEHTVPVAVLTKSLRHESRDFVSPERLHHHLMRLSVCTAMSFNEEQLLRKTPHRPPHPAFDDEGLQIGDLPFSRYANLTRIHPDFRVYNVLTGDRLNLSKFTFADHTGALRFAAAQVGQPKLYDLN